MKEHNEEKKSLPAGEAGMLDLMERKVSGGFSVPENYFEVMSENISDKVRSIPNLSSVPKANVFEVPDGYFARLENAIRENISPESISVVQQVEQWYRRPKLVLAYASVFIFVIIVSTYFLTDSFNSTVSDNDISLNDIYSSDVVNELDESALASLLDEPSASSSSAQLEDYMIDNDIDISTLTDEL